MPLNAAESKTVAARTEGGLSAGVGQRKPGRQVCAVADDQPSRSSRERDEQVSGAARARKDRGRLIDDNDVIFEPLDILGARHRNSRQVMQAGVRLCILR